MLEKLTFEVHSRLHLTLLGMHAGQYRMNGGIGFSIKTPHSRLVFTKAEKFAVEDLRLRSINLAEQERLSLILDKASIENKFDAAFKVSIEGNMLAHSGFGSGTGITLACLEALHLINGCLIEQDMLIQASGRGGTSGIGIYTYFNGGVCI